MMRRSLAKTQHRMNESNRRRFDLARFVMESWSRARKHRHAAGLRRGRGAAARRTGRRTRDRTVPTYGLDTDPTEKAFRLSYNHPVVEAMAERLQQQPSNAHAYINHVRLSKQDCSTWQAGLRLPQSAPVARSQGNPEPSAAPLSALNFKVSLISDEKQELCCRP